MARPIKVGLEYFSHDVNLSGSLAVQALEAKYGNDGYAVYCKLLEEIYNKGYQLEMTMMNTLTVSKKCNLQGDEGVKRFEEIILFCCDVDLFEKKAYEKKKILTSDEIKNRAMVVFKKRGRIPDELALRNSNSNGRKGVVSAPESTGESPETTGESTSNTQSKVKQSKAKESTEKHIIKICEETNVQRFKTLHNIEVTEELKIAWVNFVDYRDSNKKFPFTDQAVTIAINKIAKIHKEHGDNIIELLEEAILRNWRGLFPLKESKSHKKNKGPAQSISEKAAEQEL